VGVGTGSLEGLGLNSFGDVYRGKRVLLTGHTGFKGSWLALWLRRLGAKVAGLALPPVGADAHIAQIGGGFEELLADIRDRNVVREWVDCVRPEVVFHLAAQPLVRRSYRDPVETWGTNVLGTAHLLDACRGIDSVRAIVVVTTDKCYENREWPWGYRENDALGGSDPYSASKAACELLISSWRRSFGGEGSRPLLASARAGNVIGGGDWSEDRLVPDLARSMRSGRPLEIRSPKATRPWQHVLESLSGYLLLGSKLLQGDLGCADSWNFGPGTDGNRTVEDVLAMLRMTWPEISWAVTPCTGPKEASLLQLDCAKARMQLGWIPVWSLPEGLAATSEWYRTYLGTGRATSFEQLERYVRQAAERGVAWAR
jgi:CDP-glucose 4,6-dehydratase